MTTNTCYDTQYYIYTGFSTPHSELILNPETRRGSSLCIPLQVALFNNAYFFVLKKIVFMHHAFKYFSTFQTNLI